MSEAGFMFATSDHVLGHATDMKEEERRIGQSPNADVRRGKANSVSQIKVL